MNHFYPKITTGAQISTQRPTLYGLNVDFAVGSGNINPYLGLRHYLHLCLGAELLHLHGPVSHTN